MGKLDDMRRLREEQHEAKQRAADAKKKAAPKAAPAAAPEPAPTREVAPRTETAARRKSEGADEKGECPSCKKQKPLVNGVLANHQKGFGKMCPGSRQPPA